MEGTAIKTIFQKITNKSIKKTRMKDKYIILRFIGFYLWKEQLLRNKKGEIIEYRSDIDDFLAKVMEFLNDADSNTLEDISAIFTTSLLNLNQIFDHNCFRLLSKTDKKRPINMYLFEVLCYFFIKTDKQTIEVKKNEIFREINRLKSDESSSFYKALTRSTDSTVSVNERFDSMNELSLKIMNEA